MQPSFRNFLWLLPFLSFFSGYFLLDRLYRSPDLETPTLVGLTMPEALGTLSNLNLNVRLLTTKEDDMLPEGTIISQNPTPAQKIKQNQSVHVVVSKKPIKLKAPLCINKPIKILESELATQKIRVKIFELHSAYPQGLCFAQYPETGNLLQENKIILYASSSLNKPIIMPNLKMKPIKDVLEFLSTYSVSVDIKHYPNIEENHQCQTCIVTDQRPLAGSLLTLDAQRPVHIQLQAYLPY